MTVGDILKVIQGMPEESEVDISIFFAGDFQCELGAEFFPCIARIEKNYQSRPVPTARIKLTMQVDMLDA